MEAFTSAANGKATKIIISSEIQGLVGLATGVVGVAKEVAQPEMQNDPLSE